MTQTREEILNHLEEHRQYAIKAGIPAKRILGVFLYGSQNYDTSMDDSDVDSKLIYLPNFEEFCLYPNMVSKELHTDNNEHIEVKDIRLMRDMWMKQNINFMEILFTNYAIVNPIFKDLFEKYFINNREVIARYDERKTVKSIAAQMVNIANHFLKTKNYKDLYNAWRFYFFLKHYMENAPYSECLKPETGESGERDFLMSIRKETKTIKDMYEYPGYAEMVVDDLTDRARELVEESSKLKSPLHEVAAAALNEGTMEILRRSFKYFKKEDF